MLPDVTLTDQLKEHLDQFSLENLGKFARGKTGRLYRQAMAQVLSHLAAYPIRDGKAEHAEITIKINLRNIIEKMTTTIEGPFGPEEVKLPKVKGLVGSVKIKTGIDALETDDVTMATEIKNGRIVDVRFNPDNNDEPLNFDQKKLFEDKEDDSDDE